jgi:peptidoglycan/LPS O-acetylase OafA/YrhL
MGIGQRLGRLVLHPVRALAIFPTGLADRRGRFDRDFLWPTRRGDVPDVAVGACVLSHHSIFQRRAPHWLAADRGIRRHYRCARGLRHGSGIFTGASGMMEHSLVQIAEDYLVAVLFSLHIVGFSAIASEFAWIARFRRSIRWSAGATFSVYLFHHPTLLVLSAWLPWPKPSWAFRAALMLGTVVVVFALAEVTERRRQIWRRLFDRLWTRFAAVF